jgi:hypothetical protein
MLFKRRSHVRSDRRKRFLVTLAPLLVLLAATPALAVASHGPSDNPPRDFAVGSGATAFDFEFMLSAQSGPSGEDARGHMTWIALPFPRLRGEVTCLATDGNRAVAGTPNAFGPFAAFFIWVEDNGPGKTVADQAAFDSGGDANQADCQRVLLAIPSGLPLERGNVTVHDGQP